MKAGSVAASLLKVNRLRDRWNFGEPQVATKRKPFFGAGIQGKVRGVAEPRLPVLRARHFEDYENWEPDFRESRARRPPPHAASAPEQSRAGWTRGRLGNEFRIRGSWSR